MDSLLTSNQIYQLTGTFNKHFNTFCQRIVIHKTPMTVIVNQNLPVYPGYTNQSQNLNNVNYNLVSGIFSGMLIYNKNQKLEYLNDSRTPISIGDVQLKVKKDAFDFLNFGKTENIGVNGLLFNVFSDPAIQNYFGLTYYYFNLNQTE